MLKISIVLCIVFALLSAAQVLGSHESFSVRPYGTVSREASQGNSMTTIECSNDYEVSVQNTNSTVIEKYTMVNSTYFTHVFTPCQKEVFGSVKFSVYNRYWYQMNCTMTSRQMHKQKYHFVP